MALTDWAIYRLSDGYIQNVIWFDADTAQYTPPQGCGMIDIPGDGSLNGQWSMCGIGWSYIDGQFVEPQYNPAAGSKLAASVEATATELIVESTTFWAPSGVVLVGQEVASYSGISGNTLTGVARGLNGTIATAHLAGTFVQRISNI